MNNIKDYNFLIKSLFKDNKNKFFKKTDLFIKKNIGHKLITFTAIDKSLKYVERIYTNNARAYPLLGRKKIPKNKWGIDLLKNKKDFYLGKNKKEIKKLFYDYDVIFSLDCGSIINLIVKFNNCPIGTINILDKENKYNKNDVKKIRFLGVLMVPFFSQHQILMTKKKGK